MLQMIGGGSPELRRKQGASGATELVSMDAQAKPKRRAASRMRPADCLIEDVGLAEDIAETGQFLRRYQRKHLLDHQVDIGAVRP